MEHSELFFDLKQLYKANYTNKYSNIDKKFDALFKLCLIEQLDNLLRILDEHKRLK